MAIGVSHTHIKYQYIISTQMQFTHLPTINTPQQYLHPYVYQQVKPQANLYTVLSRRPHIWATFQSETISRKMQNTI